MRAMRIMITAIPLDFKGDHTDVLEFITMINEAILNGDIRAEVGDDGEIRLYAN